MNLIERGMTISSLENQFLTNESKTGVNTGKRLYQMVDRFLLRTRGAAIFIMTMTVLR